MEATVNEKRNRLNTVLRKDRAKSVNASAGEPQVGNKKKKKKKLKILIIFVAIVAVLSIGISFFSKTMASNKLSISYDDTKVLAYTDFSNSVNASGIVESGSSHNVYSSLNYTVDEVCVKVGDSVTADTLLCRLNTDDLEDQIKTKELSTGLSAKSAAQSVKTAQDNYNASKDAMDSDKNSSLISAESSVRTAYENWQKAQKTYDTYYNTIKDGLNSTLISQDSSVENARITLEAKQDDYDSAKSDADEALDELNSYKPDTSKNYDNVSAAQTAYEGATVDLEIKQKTFDEKVADYSDAQAAYNRKVFPSDEEKQALADAQAAYQAAQTALSAAQTAKDTAEDKLEDAKDNLENRTDSKYVSLQDDYDAKKTILDNAQRALTSAQLSYDTAIKSRQSAYRDADDTLADYAASVDTAYESYQTALASQSAAVTSADNSLQSNYNSLQNAQISANNDSAVLELAQLQADLDATKIYAGTEGTVTAIYAKAGSSGSGLLFVIEDVNQLVIDTSVKEYDVGSVSVGMPVTIKSEATGNDIYDGVIQSIAPTTDKNSSGETDTSDDSEFAVKVRVTSQSTKLKIGMNVRLSYILDKQAKVLTVPYDAVYTNDTGKPCILVLDEQSDSKYRIRELAVNTGLENDIDKVISGSGVKEGLRVVTDPDNYKIYIGRNVTLAQEAAQSARGFPMGNKG